MKKILIILLGVGLISSACGLIEKRSTATQAEEAEVVSMRQDSIRRADEERVMLLQMKARQDSIAMAMATSRLPKSPASKPSLRKEEASTYYVVVGSFLKEENAKAYLKEMQDVFEEAQIVRKGKWNMVCVGGKFKTFRAASHTLYNVEDKIIENSEEDEVIVTGDAIFDEDIEEVPSGESAWVVGM